MMNEKYNKDREKPPCAAEWRRNPMGRQEPIGVFDSGVGGLTVAREIMRQIPNERIVYFGDTARVPYGSKSKETVTKYSRQIIRFLQTENVKAIVIACNTASAFALDTMQKEVDLPIIGGVKQGARMEGRESRSDWDGRHNPQRRLCGIYQILQTGCRSYRKSMSAVCTAG